MEGTLVVREERGVVDKFRGWYKEKVVDTGVSQNAEKIFDWAVGAKTKVDEVICSVGSVIMGFIPEVQFLAPIAPALAKAQTGLFQFGKNAIISVKRTIEAKFIGVDGSCEDVVVPVFNQEELADNVKDAATSVKAMLDASQGVDSKEEGGKVL